MSLNDLIQAALYRFHVFTEQALGEFIRVGHRGAVYVWIDFEGGQFRADRNFPTGVMNVTGYVIDDASAAEWLRLKG